MQPIQIENYLAEDIVYEICVFELSQRESVTELN
jgi:hypothetical protein